jgi:hypothetical protein
MDSLVSVPNIYFIIVYNNWPLFCLCLRYVGHIYLYDAVPLFLCVPSVIVRHRYTIDVTESENIMKILQGNVKYYITKTFLFIFSLI